MRTINLSEVCKPDFPASQILAEFALRSDADVIDVAVELELSSKLVQNFLRRLSGAIARADVLEENGNWEL